MTSPPAPEKVVFITGASSGIGAATALAFAAEGATLVVGARRQDRLAAVADQARAAGARRVIALPLDVRSADSISAWVGEGLRSAGRADILFNNAGLARGVARVEDAPDSDWLEMFETNVVGLLRVTRALIPALIAGGAGHIIMLGSLAGHHAYEGGAAYCGSKVAVRSIREALRLELCDRPVRVSTVDPGMVETEFSVVRFSGDVARAKTVYAGIEPLVAEDIARIVHFVATSPAHVNIDEILVTPQAQGGVGKVVRRA